MASEDDMTTSVVEPKTAGGIQLVPLEKVFTHLAPQLDALEEKEFADDRAGNRLRKSYVAGLRKVRAAVENARKSAKAGALEYGRSLDATAKAHAARVESLMEPHVVVLDRIKAEEAERKQAHQDALNAMRELSAPTNEPRTSVELLQQLGDLNKLYEGRDWQEFQADALKLATEGSQALNDQITRARDSELQQAELERLRKLEVERKAREQREAQQRAEQARKDQEAENARKAQIAKEDAERKARIEREDRERQEKIDAEERERKQREEALAAQQCEVEAERQRLADEQRQREVEAAKVPPLEPTTGMYAVARPLPMVPVADLTAALDSDTVRLGEALQIVFEQVADTEWVLFAQALIDGEIDGVYVNREELA